MHQLELVIGPWDSYLDALRDDVIAVGGSKEVGEWFWREKTPEARRNCVNDRLNAERRERFTDEQEQLIMRRAVQKRGYSAAHYYRCDVLGTERPKALRIEDQQEKAQREFVEAVARFERSVQTLKALGVVVPIASRQQG
jgi:hypothetical protein